MNKAIWPIIKALPFNTLTVENGVEMYRRGASKINTEILAFRTADNRCFYRLVSDTFVSGMGASNETTPDFFQRLQG